MDAPQVPQEPAMDLVDLGRRLVNARTALDLTVEEIAQRLHLPTATIGDLECGRATRIGTPVYLKGFLRSYLRLLALPEVWAEQALAQSGAADSPIVRPAAGALARRVSWLDRYKWAASYVVGTALALTAVHWLVSNTPQLGLPDSRSLSTEIAVPQAPTPVTSSLTLPSNQPIAQLGPVAAAQGSETPASSAQGMPPMLASLSPFRVNPPAASISSAVPLELQIDQNSWIEVRDQQGDKLESKIVAAGEQRSFSVGAPFSVSIGNVGGVRASIGGELIDLLPYTKGNVARFDVTERDGRWSAQAREAEAAGAREEG